eukprot:COSAG01_NODE_3296_length_6298_cov_2.497500_6_plen_134_part_00
MRWVGHQGSQFLGEVAYHEYEGISDDVAEKELIMDSLGGTASVLIMRNHGYCTLGKTVGQAWVRAWYLEKCCQLQLDVMASGGTIHYPGAGAMQKGKQQYEGDFESGLWEWPAIMRKWRRVAQQCHVPPRSRM